MEAKTYVVDIPIRIIGGDSVLVTFTGVGFDQRIMGDTMRPRDSESIGVPSKQVVPIQHQVLAIAISVLYLKLSSSLGLLLDNMYFRVKAV